MKIHQPIFIDNRPGGKISPEIVAKDWGYEVVIHNSPDYCMKILNIQEGKELRPHLHLAKRESWYVAEGRALILYSKNRNDYQQLLEEGESFQIPPGLIHSVQGMNGPVKIIEASTQHFDEDSIRI